MFAMAKNNVPRHVGFIPDGNRRWATDHDLPKEAGYAYGIDPGLLLYEKCKECGIEEASIRAYPVNTHSMRLATLAGRFRRQHLRRGEA